MRGSHVHRDISFADIISSKAQLVLANSTEFRFHQNVGVITNPRLKLSGGLAGNKIVDHPNVAGATPVGAAPTTSSFST